MIFEANKERIQNPDMMAVNESALDLTGLSGPTVNEFHITEKTSWPKGAYQVEILLNGASAMKKDFTVK